MSRPRWSTRIALWVAVCALLLKAAVPMLATASAHAQGKTLVEVCTVYGVATVALDDAGAPKPMPDHPAAHGDDHCALTALMALAANGPQWATALAMPPQTRAPPAPARASSNAPDACATWVARLKHGPPLFA